MLPTVVPRLRIVGWATCRRASRSSGCARGRLVALDLRVPGQRTDPDRVGVDVDVVEARDAG